MRRHEWLLLGVLAFAVSFAHETSHGQDIEQLKRSGNWRGLVPNLNDKNPEVRQQAAVALHEVVKGVKSQAELKQLMPPLIAATLRDPVSQVRVPARFALRDVLSAVEDRAALVPVMQSLVAGLTDKDPTIRTWCAHDLPGVV